MCGSMNGRSTTVAVANLPALAFCICSRTGWQEAGGAARLPKKDRSWAWMLQILFPQLPSLANLFQGLAGDIRAAAKPSEHLDLISISLVGQVLDHAGRHFSTSPLLAQVKGQRRITKTFCSAFAQGALSRASLLTRPSSLGSLVSPTMAGCVRPLHEGLLANFEPIFLCDDSRRSPCACAMRMFVFVVCCCCCC